MSADRNSRACDAVQRHPLDSTLYRRCGWAEHDGDHHEWLDEWIASAMPKPNGVTPPRSVRIPDDLWNAAKERAAERGETVTDVLIRALRRYVR